MGLLNETQLVYNDTVGNKGNYQFVSLDEIISSFMVVYVGEGKILSKASRTDVQFHGMRAIQELSYDILRSHKAYEIEVPNTLVMYLPQDYVNYTKIVRVDSSGIEKPLYPTGKTSNPFPINQSDAGSYIFGSGTGEILSSSTSGVSATNPHTSDTRTNFNTIESSSQDYDYNNTDHFGLDQRGRRYGLDPQHAQSNGTFYIDNSTGFIHFSSDLAGKTITLKYISDGLGTDSEMVVHKFAEEAIYKHIMYGLISGRTGIPEYIVQRYKKERFAESRKAKIRLSNIKMEEFTQVLRGISKPIK
jgi:hypothetical protein|tara:strand:- start:2083 stop:2991 length:909 start_codon:yes stop_codon:yes gene_type:complete